MDFRDEYVQSCAANEMILNSTDATPNEKAAAWRRQAIILHKISSDLPNVTSSALMAQHYSKLNSEAHNQYMQDRVESVKMLLKGFPKQSAAVKETLNELPKIDDNLFEPPCHGTYESCRHDEITEEDLKSLSKPESPTTSSPVARFAQNSIESKTSGVNSAATSSGPIMNFLLNKQKWSMGNCAGAAGNALTLPKTSLVASAATASNYTAALGSFRTAREELALQNLKKENFFKNAPSTSAAALNTSKRTLGGRRTVRSDFVLPTKEKPAMMCNTSADVISPSPPSIGSSPEMIDERLSNIDPKMIAIITKEIMCNVQAVDWDDIAGLEYAKSIIIETIICPLLRPDIYTGLRTPRRGILLFGPPGTGKTLIAKCIASQSKSTFFSISPSILTSKYVGEGEKMVRALFAAATKMQPSVIFIDEIDSLLSQRSETEHESSRRLKTEFLIQFDGAATSDDDRILFIAATNRPQELDDAARRRFEKRLYIPLPEAGARIQIITNLLQKVRHNLSTEEIKEMGGSLTEGYSCADMKSLCVEASMEPVRAIPLAEFANFDKDNIRAVNMQDFHTALQKVRPSVSQKDLKQYVEWNSIYGASR